MTPAVANPGSLPDFPGGTYDDHVQAALATKAKLQRGPWELGAIAVSLMRCCGGRPARRYRQHRSYTLIQQFCRDVHIDRQTFQRLVRTYRVWSAISRTTGGTDFTALPFKYYEVAARIAGPADAVAAIAEARAMRWSANQLERELVARLKTGADEHRRFSRDDAYWRLDTVIQSWPPEAHAIAPSVLRQLADDWSRRLDLDDDLPDCLRDDNLDCHPVEVVRRRA